MKALASPGQVFPERAAAFSAADTYSNLLGVKIAPGFVLGTRRHWKLSR
jgi:hypothetical protein